MFIHEYYKETNRVVVFLVLHIVDFSLGLIAYQMLNTIYWRNPIADREIALLSIYAQSELKSIVQ